MAISARPILDRVTQQSGGGGGAGGGGGGGERGAVYAHGGFPGRPFLDRVSHQSLPPPPPLSFVLIGHAASFTPY